MKNGPCSEETEKHIPAFVLCRTVICVLARDLLGNFMNLAVCLSYFEYVRTWSSQHPEAEVAKLPESAPSSGKIKADGL